MTRSATLAACFAFGALACEPPPPTSADGVRQPEIASVYRSRCGACHVRVEPATRTREQLESAFERHRRRLRLREDQWRDLVSYLAIPEPPPPPAAPVPCLPDPLTPASPPTAVPSTDEKRSP
jgi:hypothetical protein